MTALAVPSVPPLGAVVRVRFPSGPWEPVHVRLCRVVSQDAVSQNLRVLWDSVDRGDVGHEWTWYRGDDGPQWREAS